MLPEKVYGILGKPLKHSLSPLLHSWGFGRAVWPGVYLAWEKEAGELPAFFAAVRGLPVSGLSVTLPHKQAVLPFLDEVTPRAGTVGAVNTIFWRQGRLTGENTDVAGFLAPLRELRSPLPAAVLLLGAGGVSRAVLAGLAEYGSFSTTVACRNPEKAAALADEFGCRLVGWEERVPVLQDMGRALVINATPLGMRGANEGESPLPEAALAALARSGADASLVYDLIYVPRRTRLLSEAAGHGLRTLGGLDFFVAQGREQFRLWTDRELPAEEARAVVAGGLEAREADPDAPVAEIHAVAGGGLKARAAGPATSAKDAHAVEAARLEAREAGAATSAKDARVEEAGRLEVRVD